MTLQQVRQLQLPLFRKQGKTHYLKRPTWQHLFKTFGLTWTSQAIDCYQINSQCEQCLVPKDIQPFCSMKHLVPLLLNVFGNPSKEKYYLGKTLEYLKTQPFVTREMLKKQFKHWKHSFKWAKILNLLVQKGMLKRERSLIQKFRPDGSVYYRWSPYRYFVISEEIK